MDIDKLAELAQAVIDARDTKRALTVTDHSVALNRFEQAATPELIIAVIVRLLKAEALLSQKEIEFAGALERTRTLFKYKNEWADRARKAESQLAELANQEPVSMRYRWCPPHLKESDGSTWIGEWKYCDLGMANPGKDYERQDLFTRAAPTAPFVVKAPEFRVHAQHPTMAAGMRDNDWKEAIKAAGVEVAE